MFCLLIQIRELDSELENEQHRHMETQKNSRLADRRLKEIAFQADEDRKTQDRLQETVDKLNAKLKIYKTQVEEAVSTASSHHFSIRITRSCKTINVIEIIH